VPLFLVPFSVFFACCAAQLYLARKLRQALAARHPGVWRELSSKAWFIDNAVLRFAFRRRDRALNDPDLTKTAKQLQLLYVVAIVAWLSLAALMFSGHSFIAG